jgi:hypothetical protein
VSKVKQFPKTLQPGYTLLKTNKVENFIVEAFRESIKFLTDLKLLCSIQKGPSVIVNKLVLLKVQSDETLISSYIN